MPLTNYFVNTIITALQGPTWQMLLERCRTNHGLYCTRANGQHRIGEDAMFHLLFDTSIFVALPNGCLCQMTGDAIVNLRPPDGPRPLAGCDSLSAEESLSTTCGGKRIATGVHPEERPLKRRRLSRVIGGQPIRNPKVAQPDRCVQSLLYERDRANVLLGCHQLTLLSSAPACSTLDLV